MGKLLGILIAVILLSLGINQNTAHARQHEIHKMQKIISKKKFRKGKRLHKKGNEHSEKHHKAKLLQPRYRGTGCPQGTASIGLSPDKKTISFLFDEFINEVGGPGGLNKDLKRCILTIPFEVPKGYMATVVALDYRGYNFIPKRGRTIFKTAYYITKRGQKKREVDKIVRNEQFKGPIDDEYFLSTEVTSGKRWSRCGQDFTLHVNASLKSVSPRGDELYSTVDSLDSVASHVALNPKSNLKYHLLWKKCKRRD